MTKKNSTVSTCQRTALLACLFIFSATLLAAIAAKPAALSARTIQNRLDVGQLAGVWEGMWGLRSGVYDDYRPVQAPSTGPSASGSPVPAQSTTLRVTAASPVPAPIAKIPAQGQNRSSAGFNDRLFEPQIYSLLKSGGELDGGLIGPQYAGRRLNRDQVAAIALERFITAATDKGISKAEITAAMFEGRFNPDLEDVQLVWEGLGNSQEEQQPEPQQPSGPRRRGSVPQEPRKRYEQPIEFRRNQAWDKHFGAITGIMGVRTIINGQEVNRAARDIILRLVMYKKSKENFQDFYGITPNPSLTYEKLTAHIRSLQMAAFEVSYRFQSIGNDMSGAERSHCAYTYFALPANNHYSGFDFRKDYEDLRNRLYLRTSQQTIANANSPPVTPARPGHPAETSPDPVTSEPPEKPIKAPRASTKTPRASSTAAVKGSCDDLAAHPDDKSHSGAGVADEKIASGPAIEKCTAAIRQNPDTARFHFQLGRAFWAAKRYDEALEAFLKAEEMSYAPAYFYLGQGYEKGLAETGKPDPAAARDLYMLAAAGGFAPAIQAYGEFEEIYELDYEAFKAPSFLKAIYNFQETGPDGKQINLLEKRIQDTDDRRRIATYIRGMQEFLSARPNPVDTACDQIYDRELDLALNEILTKETLPFLKSLSQAPLLAELFDNGQEDMYRLAAEYGGCQGPVVTQIFKHIKQYIRANPAKRNDQR